MVETLGLTAFTVGHSARMASKSSAVSVFILPEPPRAPNERMLPDQTWRVLVPMAAISSCTCFCAPAPRLTIAITAPTPMMMPSIVRIERILFRFSAFRAIFKITQKLIFSSPENPLLGGIARSDCGREAPGWVLLLFHPPLGL